MTEPSKIEIVLVEDSDEDAEMTVRALRKRNLANGLHRCRDGEEALEFLLGEGSDNRRPRVILLDLKMPKVDGLTVLERLRADERTRKVPVVALTSSKEDSDLKRAYELGVNSYIVKPVDFDKFARVVEELGLYWLLLNESPS